MQHRPNILVLSAGGFGHIPIPLIKGELAPSAIPVPFHWDVGMLCSLVTLIILINIILFGSDSNSTAYLITNYSFF